MMRWIRRAGAFGEHGEAPDVDAFLAEVVEVCRRHGMSISHEDAHGAFEVVDFDEGCAEWLTHATDARPRAAPAGGSSEQG
jgi:ribulose-5-phosphate 4-epimerase/fuculose-1-phosphate aldolase